MESKGEVKKSSKSFPLEDPERVYRIYNVLSYFFVLVVIGLPIWWYTTRVYRANLPLDEMQDMILSNKTNQQFGIPLSLEYDILITVVNPDPQNLKLELDGSDIEAYIEPFINKISSVAEFVVKSQWLYLVELGAVPRKIVDHYALSEEQLPHVITPLEKKLWSHLSPRPCLNLVLYVSHCEVPLYIYNSRNERTGNAFLSPRWGGIYILNPDKSSCELKQFQPDLRLISSTFTTLLMKMLQMKGKSPEDVRDLQKRKAEDMIESAKRTLKSLAQLLSEINSIVISDDVASKIKVAVDNVQLADRFLKENNIEEALEFAKIAFNNSEAAFSHPSLLALLYFPDDQKYAVYIPLFLPVMIPVLMSLLTVKKWYKDNKVKVA